ncbi:hypothetical protein PROFUN_09304 [Planoprotostelium fungivorum]|uniref:Rhodanese domain-containing protein n=1 Tax=Planoprotostelium fungivorum TaxID=1890364 RepID=A0A2P6NH90_9EUKA|nr:hypothetical protein PROFUN_09304 [Planoprotostelium fungivorum]
MLSLQGQRFLRPALRPTFQPKSLKTPQHMSVIPKRGLIQTINRTELEELLKKRDQDFLLVDVREPSEVLHTGPIPSAVNVPLGQLDTELAQNKMFADKEKPIIFYCKVGGRSELACELAKNLGYKNTKNYRGSAKEWFNLA